MTLGESPSVITMLGQLGVFPSAPATAARMVARQITWRASRSAATEQSKSPSPERTEVTAAGTTSRPRRAKSRDRGFLSSRCQRIGGRVMPGR